MTILVTGGAGYIGSHTVVCLLEAGRDVVVVDNLANSREESLRRVARITGRSVAFEKGDIRDRPFLEEVIGTVRRDVGRPFRRAEGRRRIGEQAAGLLRGQCRRHGERCSRRCRRKGVKSIVFSSSATVYGEPQQLPIPEDHPLSATNPYGRTKLMIEDILRDLHAGDPLVANRDAALLQSGRRARERPDRRGSERHSRTT